MLMRVRWLRRLSLVGVLAAPLLLTLGATVSQAQQTPPALSGGASATSIVEPKVLDILKAACNVLTEAKTMCSAPSGQKATPARASCTI